MAEQIENYRHYVLEDRDLAELKDICFTSNIGRHHFEHRLGIVAHNKQELINKLSATTIDSSLLKNNKLAFLFTGQGSQYLNMAQELYSTQPVFQENCDRCFEVLEQYLDVSLKKVNL